MQAINHLIHPTAVIESDAKIGHNVKIGPFCLVGSEVVLSDNIELKSHVVIEGRTSIGENTIIYPFASIGHKPQDLKYNGEKSEIVVGSNNIIREYVTIQSGTKNGGMLTSIGNNCLLMLGVHIGHDCKVGDNVIFANYVSLAGHVVVGDYTVIGGLAAIHQYVRIGKHSMIGGLSAVVHDLIPFGMASSERAKLEGLNLVGIKRRGFNTQEALNAKLALDELFNNNKVNNFTDKVELVKQKYTKNSIVMQIIDFINQDHTRNLCRMRTR